MRRRRTLLDDIVVKGTGQNSPPFIGKSYVRSAGSAPVVLDFRTDVSVTSQGFRLTCGAIPNTTTTTTTTTEPTTTTTTTTTTTEPTAQDDPCQLEEGGGGTFSTCKLCPAGAIVGSRTASATTPTPTKRLGVESEAYTISTDLSYVPQHHFNITTTGAAEVINNMDATSRVVGGADAPRATYSWMTALYVESEYTPGNYFFTCGGALIGPKDVATAAHCVDGREGRNMLLGVGRYIVSRVPDDNDGLARFVEVNRVIVHPEYNPQTVENDIAILRLEEDVGNTNTPIPIAVVDGTPALSRGSQLRVIGWGTTEEGGSISDTLQQATVPLLDDETCTRTVGPPVDLPFDGRSMLCAGFENGGTDTCQGDSGGPLVYDNGDSALERRFELVGLTSWGIGCARRESPGVYVNLINFAGWLLNKTNKQIRTSCEFHTTSKSRGIRTTSLRQLAGSDDICWCDNATDNVCEPRQEFEKCPNFLIRSLCRASKRECERLINRQVKKRMQACLNNGKTQKQCNKEKNRYKNRKCNKKRNKTCP